MNNPTAGTPTAETAAPRRYDVTAEAADAGARIDRLLAARLPALSRSRIKALIEQGCLSVGGATIVEPSYRVKPGQTFAIIVPEPAPATPQAQAIPLDVLYEDESLVVLDKPAGLVVHPAPGNPDRTLVNALLAHCGPDFAGIGGVRRPGIVHRLDKDTSGLMVVAKTEAAYHALAAQFAARDVERAYLAIVWGAPEPAVGEISGNIGRSPRNRKKMAVLRHGGRPARTRYRVVQRLADGAASLVECRLLSGRTHQIRVHMAARGHPLIGDPLYGGGSRARLARLPAGKRAAAAAFRRQALHAATLGFRHPQTGELLRFNREPPPDFKALKLSLE
ncbi:MAG: RluA family pseudouridine synthase [Alphaproteobacteria bacterium]|nr:MAG: RluA family pseudouridine synthase [Alphaproteobacteria bacterium]